IFFFFSEAALINPGGVEEIETAAAAAASLGDSVGGLIECRIGQVPAGLGEPFFDSAESLISHIIFAIPAIKAIEFGVGFAAAGMKGSQYNDEIVDGTGKTGTNNSGGINGGITNGNDLVFRVAVRPTASIGIKQQTINLVTGDKVDIEIAGRHDACIALRAPVVVESAAAIALCDMILLKGVNNET
ncbi:MAG: chorismate synthase, partial [Planctomycetes bacterium]|nr:chorismate synthase [Planctomycetota bacterium]